MGCCPELLANTLLGSTALTDISVDPPGETNLMRRVDVDAQVVHLTKLSVMQRENAFDEEDRCRLDGLRLSRKSRVGREVVDGRGNRVTVRKQSHLVKQQLGFD